MLIFSGRGETTDLALMVEALAQEDRSPWNAYRIRDALIREAGVDPATAEEIALEVEADILRHGKERVTTSTIRELVNVKLFFRGLDAKLADHSRLGLPVYDLESMMLSPNRENSNTSHNPESINLSIAEMILKEYALKKVFPGEVARAHLAGDIHLHDLGMVNRPYCSGQSMAYVIRYGLDLPSITSVSAPASTRCSSRPYSQDDIGAAEQLCRSHRLGCGERILCPLSDGASLRKGQAACPDADLRVQPARRGKGGAGCLYRYQPLLRDTRSFQGSTGAGTRRVADGQDLRPVLRGIETFLRALFEVYLEGDSRGQPFFFPKPLLHITDRFFQEPGWEEFLRFACLVASEKGSTYFVFDRGVWQS